MRALFCGDRNWENQSIIQVVMSGAASDAQAGMEPFTVIHGCAPGADTLAGRAAKKMGLAIEEYPAQWSEYGKAAGPIRNEQMLEEGRPDVVFAFHSNLGLSKGTADMVRRARRVDLPVYIIAEAE